MAIAAGLAVWAVGHLFMFGRIDLWLPCLLGAASIVVSILAGVVIAAAHRLTLVATGPFCVRCHYDLTDSTAGVCPECGATTRRGAPE